MGAIIPVCVPETQFHHALEAAGVFRIHRGKVRDTYKLPDKEVLLVIATNRVSIFDFVLPAIIPDKGAILSALTIFWLTEVLTDIPNHLVTYGRGIDQHLPESIRNCSALHHCAIVVNRLNMLPIECVVRGYLTGNGWKEYQSTNGIVYGVQLEQGLHDGSQILPSPLFTPTSKEEIEHDKPVTLQSVIDAYGTWPQDKSLTIYNRVATFCSNRRLIFADTKFEFGDDGTLADEVATPDSSRIWDVQEWGNACHRNEPPPSFDKQIVREWGKRHGVNNFKNPADPDALAFVAGLTVPHEIIELTGRKYGEVFHRLTGRSLSEFQQTILC